MNLVRAELARLFARRFTRIGLAGLLLLLVVIGVAIAATNHKPTDADVVSAKIQLDNAHVQMLAAYQQCLDAQSGKADTPEAQRFVPGFDCHEITAHPPVLADYMPSSFNLASTGPDLFRILGALLALFGFAVGASSIGAEWSSGGVMNLLLWRPNRIPVWLGKLGSLLLGVLGVGAVLSVVWYATLWLLADNRGSAAMTAGALRSLALVDVRALTLALATTALGYAIAALGRNTASALGVAVAWVVVFEIGLRIVLGLLEAVRPERWYLSTYAGAWLTNSARFYDDSMCRNTTDACAGVWWTVSSRQAALVGAVVLLVAALPSLYAFRKRDVT
jgi:hypothetical protein